MQRTNSYTYEPLVGVKTVTDASGETITYEYDSRNRLHLIRDEDNNIIKRYRYNYGVESNEIEGWVVRTGTTVPGETITFEAIDVEAYGDDALNEYKWTIDGTQYTGNPISHTFSSQGTYNGTLSIINPEYDAPKNIGVSTAIAASAYQPNIQGPTSYENCGHVPGTTVSYSIFYLITGMGICYDGSGSGGTHEWEYRSGTGSWSDLGTATSCTLPEGILYSEGDYEIRYTFTDECGYTYVDTHTLNVFCNSGGGGIH